MRGDASMYAIIATNENNYLTPSHVTYLLNTTLSGIATSCNPTNSPLKRRYASMICPRQGSCCGDPLIKETSRRHFLSLPLLSSILQAITFQETFLLHLLVYSTRSSLRNHVLSKVTAVQLADLTVPAKPSVACRLD